MRVLACKVSINSPECLGTLLLGSVANQLPGSSPLATAGSWEPISSSFQAQSPSSLRTGVPKGIATSVLGSVWYLERR